MKLLIISNNLDRPGFKQRIVVHLDDLRANGIDYEVAKLPSGSLSRWKLFRQAAHFDGVLLHKKGLNLLNALWLRRYSKKIVYHFDDAIMYSDKAPERYSGAHYRPWKRSVKLADMVIVGSSYLAELAKRYNSNVKIISTAVQIEDYRVDSPIQSDGKIRLVWIGSKSSTSYLAEIVPVLEKIGAGFNNIVLRIISDEFLDLKNMPVEKVLWEKRSRGIKLAECDIGIAPLPDNPFTQGKCSFKVLEYMASGLPIVASPIGTNKDHIREGITGFLVENHDQWLEKISLLVRTPQLRTSMGMQGRQFAQQFDVTVIGKRLAEIIKKCLAGTS